MNYVGIKNRFLLCIIAVAMVVCTMFFVVHPTIVYAAEGEIQFDNINVLDDLSSSTVNGEIFNITQYPFDEQGSIKIVSFVEYCYSYKANMRSNYGLYVYVYNPQDLEIDTRTKQNKIQMATSYKADGTPNGYTKFNLEFCNRVEEGDYKNLFYKFKVVDEYIEDKTFAERVNSNNRRYDVTGIELLTAGNHNATEYGVGGTYIYTGYSQGYGPDANAESTLTCVVEDLETLELSVHQTNFRTNVSSLGKDHYNEVTSVYFSVPNRIFNTYGNLQQIQAEWWEYKSKMAAITSNYDYYENTLLKYIGTDVGEYNPNVANYLYSGYSSQSYGTSLIIYNYAWCYNRNLVDRGTLIKETFYSQSVSSIMPYAFYSPAVDVDSVFNFLYTDPIAGDVESTQIQEWIYNYSNNLGHGYVDCNGRELSKDLFEEHVDEGRTMGYNNKTIDLSDTFDLNSYNSNHTWWDKLWDYGFSWPATSGDYKDVSPIYEVKASDLSKPDADVARSLLVNENDVAALKAFYSKETLKGNRVILFRFANTDYYCAPAHVPHIEKVTDTDTYVAQQTLFLDFDIIQLTFNKEGSYHVIPAVSSPIDVVKDFTQPPAELQWWKILLIVLAVILLIILLWPILPYILYGIAWLICFPYNSIKCIVQSVRDKKNAKQESNNKEE